MWYPAAVTVAATELVTLAEAQRQARSDTDADLDAELTRLITVARNHVEKYCGIRIGSQTVALKCDCFADLARLPEAPVTSVTSIVYLDADGVSQTLSTSVYELRADGLDVAIVLKYGQSWPSIQPGSRITLTLVAGYTAAPPAIHHAQLLLIGHWFENHEAASAENIMSLPHAVDDLLSNYRRGP